MAGVGVLAPEVACIVVGTLAGTPGVTCTIGDEVFEEAADVCTRS